MQWGLVTETTLPSLSVFTHKADWCNGNPPDLYFAVVSSFSRVPTVPCAELAADFLFNFTIRTVVKKESVKTCIIVLSYITPRATIVLRSCLSNVELCVCLRT